MTATTKWVTVAEYARMRQLSERTVHRRLAQGLIPGAEQPRPQCAYRIPVAA